MLAGGCQQACPLPEPCPVAEACDACRAAAQKAATPDKGEGMAEESAALESGKGAKVGVKQRSELDPKYLWKKDRLFASYDAFKASLEASGRDIALVSSCGSFATAGDLSRCLELYFRLHTQINKLTLYANMTVDTEPSAQTRADQKAAASVLSQFMDAASVVRDGILKLDSGTLDRYFSEDASLKVHEAYVRNIARRASRVLSPDAERVLRLAGDNLWAEIDLNEIHSNSEDVFDSMLGEMALPVIHDESGKAVQLTLSNYAKFRRSPDRAIRKAAVEGLMDTLASYEDVFANAYIGQLGNDVLFAKARNYPSALEAYLDKDDIPVEIYKNLLETVGRNLEPLHRYVSLRKKVLGLDSVHLYDMYIPLSKGSDRTYSYDEAVSLITAALAPLGSDYIEKLKKEMDPEKGSIDLYPHADKASGAYSCSVYGVDPFILMNYQESLDDVSTLAHELGHSMHSIYSGENQPASTYHYTMFLAEIASTTNEAILNDYLYKNAKTDAERIDLLVDKLENIRGTIYRQTMFAEFEYLAHTRVEQNLPIGAQWLSETYAALVKKYYGPEFSMIEHDDHEWAYIPHFYYKYYVYSYATGLSSALSFASLIESDPANAEKYIRMLKSGSSKDSVTLLREAGVDLATPAPIEFALKSFDETLTELEKLLGV